MPVTKVDIGEEFSQLSGDISGALKELERELQKVSRQTEALALKGKPIDEAIAKRKAELDKLYAQAREQSVQSARKHLLSPQATTEVKSVAKSIVKDEIRRSQKEIASAILNGRGISTQDASRIQELNTIVASSQQPIQRTVAPLSQAYIRNRARFDTGGLGIDSMNRAFALRGRIRSVMSLAGDMQTGDFSMGTVADLADVRELAAMGSAKAAGWLGTSALASKYGKVANVLNKVLGAGSAWAMPVAGGAAISIGLQAAVTGYANSAASAVKKNYETSDQAAEAAFGKYNRYEALMQLRRFVTQKNSLTSKEMEKAYGDVSDLAKFAAEDKAGFNAAAFLAVNANAAGDEATNALIRNGTNTTVEALAGIESKGGLQKRVYDSMRAQMIRSADIERGQAEFNKGNESDATIKFKEARRREMLSVFEREQFEKRNLGLN